MHTLAANWAIGKWTMAMAYPESEVFETLGESREGLIAGAGLGNQCKRSRWAGQISARNLDTSGLAGLILEGA